MPYKNFYKSIHCLDYRRLGKQRVEAKQILNIICNRTKSNAWRNHPIVKMWSKYPEALKLYYNLCLCEWISRGYNNTMKFETIGKKVEMPKWFGNRAFHRSHKSNLLRKDKKYYKKYFGKMSSKLPYVWIIE